jgi:hypothetical protein
LETGVSRYRWIAATSGSQSAASLELATAGDPVMAIGGFDNEGGQLTLAQFERYVKAGDIHYYIVSSGGPGGGGTGGFGGASGTGRNAAPGRIGTASGSGGFPGAAGGSTSGSSDSSSSGRGPGGAGGRPGTGGSAGGSSTSSITSWVEAHFTKQTIGGVTVYNLTKSA